MFASFNCPLTRVVAFLSRPTFLSFFGGWVVLMLLFVTLRRFHRNSTIKLIGLSSRKRTRRRKWRRKKRKRNESANPHLSNQLLLAVGMSVACTTRSPFISIPNTVRASKRAVAWALGLKTIGTRFGMATGDWAV